MKKIRLTKVRTTCDGCGKGGLIVFVPRNEDGSVAGREFPSLCSVCLDAKEIQDRVLRRFMEAEGATSIDVDGVTTSCP